MAITAPAQDVGVRRAVIYCGLSGDAARRKAFADSIEKLYAGLTAHHGFKAENVRVHFGEATTEADGPALKSSGEPLTREAFLKSAAALTQAAPAEDAAWIFVFGHAHYDGKQSWLNIAGPDISHVEFAKAFAGLHAKEQVFFITSPASGFYIKPLAAPGRIVITATEPDFEVNETAYPHKLAIALGDPPEFGEMDVDADGRLSLLDIYLWTARAVAQEYATADLLATEHARLDDNGDGRASEVQLAYLPEELGGRRRGGRRRTPPANAGDGELARRLRLYYPASPPAPDTIESPADDNPN
jgi:hypothetical protein